MGVSRERKCLLNIVSQKLISYDFCTSSVLHKAKKTFGGSKWKLIELTRVSRYLAYVKAISSGFIALVCWAFSSLSVLSAIFWPAFRGSQLEVVEQVFQYWNFPNQWFCH
jgi:hypothetical protein